MSDFITHMCFGACMSMYVNVFMCSSIGKASLRTTVESLYGWWYYKPANFCRFASIKQKQLMYIIF